MRWIGLVVVVWFAMGGVAEAHKPRQCWDPHLDPFTFECSREVVAHRQPQSFIALRSGGWAAYISHWVAADGEQFVTPGDRRCLTFSRYHAFRVRESWCGGRLVATYRSLVGPRPLTFEWETWPADEWCTAGPCTR